MFNSKIENVNNLRSIKTARDKSSINEAALNGFKPLLKKVQPSPEIRSKYAILQHKVTGVVEVIGDFRSLYEKEDDFEKVIDWTYHYPYKFKSPFAAYLIPMDIAVGERVFIEDLIEDFIGASWNQGNNYRLESCEAIWNGKDFEIQYNPHNHRSDFVG